MKILKGSGIAILAALTITNPALAIPIVGSTSTYSINGDSDGLTSMKLLINEVSLRANTIWADGEYRYANGTEKLTKDEEFTYTHYRDLELTFNDCVGNGGSMESVTVPAGTFQACHWTDSSGANYWISPAVPFNYVKLEYEYLGSYIVEELQSFSMAI